MNKRLFIFGLDAAPPELLFKKFRKRLRNFDKILSKSVYGEMRSCDPPITIPAWMVMMSGREPGELGLYGFRHRKCFSYVDIKIPTSRDIKVDKVWDYLGRHNLKSFVMGIPPTYPPYPINGWMISGFLAPDDKSNYTYPLTLKYEIKKIVDEYIFDVPFRSEDREWVLNNIFKMTDIHRKVVNYMMQRKKWDLFIYMEIGLDRVQHAFWKYMDERHNRYTYHDKFFNAILEYYILLDEILGDIIHNAPDSDILIVSDHGAKKMDGAFAVNDWLIEKGYLKAKGDVKPGSKIEDVDIDWSDTLAWGWGGYYARIFLNIKDREENGVIEPEEVPNIISRLRSDILSIRGPNGEKWRNLVYTPSELYKVVNGNPPDLLVYFDDLNWRSAGTFGYDDYYLPENDTGPDDAVHDYNGVFIWYSSKFRESNKVDIRIYDILPTILKYFDIEPPSDLRGSVIGDVLR